MGKKKSKKQPTWKNSVSQYTAILAVFVVSFAWGSYSFQTMTEVTYIPPAIETEEVFPIGVNPHKKEITEQTDVDSYYRAFVNADGPRLSVRRQWFRKAIDKVALSPWYQSLASVSSRTLVIYAGERKEQVAYNFSRILKWSAAEKKEFLAIIEDDNPSIAEGKFYPGRYVVSKDASPSDVAELVYGKFNTEILSRYTDEIQQIVPLEDALALASLLEREAYDFEDMRYISGVIWNRMFVDMKLQIDATLQYARASAWGGSWWPVPRPSDKQINSPFNTYLHNGLPPHPIANPSAEAVLATLNPRETTCMYYFHDSNGGFHCSETYEEHKALLKQHY